MQQSALFTGVKPLSPPTAKTKRVIGCKIATMTVHKAFYKKLAKRIQSVLNPALIDGPASHGKPSSLHDLTYPATCALYWLLGGPNSDYVPHVITHRTCPTLFGPGETHWFLKNAEGDVLDVGVPRFGHRAIPYERGSSNTMMNHPVGGGNVALMIMRRVQERYGVPA